MSTKPVCISGDLVASYKGVNLQRVAEHHSEMRNLLLFDLVITNAAIIDGYNIAELDAANADSLMPLMVKNVQVSYVQPSGNVPVSSSFSNLYKVIITHVQLYDTIDRHGDTYGKLSGKIYATIEPKPLPQQPSVSPGTTVPTQRPLYQPDTAPGCLPHIGLGRTGCLPWLALILGLLIFWCVISGNCVCNGCEGCGNSGPGKSENYLDTTRTGKEQQGNLNSKVYSDTLSGSDKRSMSDVQKRVGKDGLVTLQLEWEGSSDLDLWVITPIGDTINYKNPNGKGGMRLDFDANADESKLLKLPVEHVYLPYEAKNYKGTYQVWINLYDLRKNRAIVQVPYSLSVKYKGNLIRNGSDSNRIFSGYLEERDLQKPKLITEIVL